MPLMAGIVSYGSYVPYRRLKRSAIAAVLGTPAGKGERAIASFDEDSVSMAVEAARDAIKSAPPGEVQALIFATTTPPYAEKLSAAVIGAAAMLPAEIRASDMTGSVRAGMSAILQGADAVSGGAKRALVAIGDSRLAAPEGKAEQTNRRRCGRVRARRRQRDRRNRGERLAHARVPRYLARERASALRIHGKNASR